MRRRISTRFRALFLALLLLTAMPGAPASGATGTPTPTPTRTPAGGETTAATDETEHSSKTSGKYVRKPPFVITVEDTNKDDLSETGVTASRESRLTLIGQNDGSKLEGTWNFAFRYHLLYDADVDLPEELVGGVAGGFELSGVGNATAALKTPPTPSPTPTPLFPDDKEENKDDEDPLATLVPPTAAQVPTAEFDAEIPMVYRNTRGSDTVGGRLESPGGSQWVQGSVTLYEDGTVIQTKAHFKITVQEGDQVNVEVTADGRTEYFAGWLTSQKELETKRKETWKWPIWGVWTNINPYNAMPGVEKDLAALEEDPEKKIAYPAGKWMSMKAGRKEDPSTYQIVESTAAGVVWESGEIWPYPGSALFRADFRRTYSADLKTLVKEEKPAERPLSITYQTASDSLWIPEMGTLVRVRSSVLPGSWSDAGDVPVPGPGADTTPPDGTWYVFARETVANAGTTDAPDALTGYSGAGTFTRIRVENGKVTKTDKGGALCMPIGEEDLLELTGISSESGKETIDLPDESLLVTDFVKAAGTVRFNGAAFANVGNPSPTGTWYTHANAPVAPDTENGGVKPRRADGAVAGPQPGMQWLTLNEDKTFVWTQVLHDEDGLLVEKGKFRTVGGNLLQLSNMTGTFIPFDEDAAGFEDTANALGDRLLQFTHDKSAKTLELAGAGTFKKLEQ